MPPENCELSVRVASVNLLRDILEGGAIKYEYMVKINYTYQYSVTGIMAAFAPGGNKWKVISSINIWYLQRESENSDKAFPSHIVQLWVLIQAGWVWWQLWYVRKACYGNNQDVATVQVPVPQKLPRYAS